MKKAFTLVEVLITIVLLTLLLSTAMFAFKFFIKRLDTMSLSLPKDAMAYEYLNHSIEGLYFYPINIKKNFKTVNQYFFQTTDNSLTYITTTPIYYKTISVAKIQYDNHKLYYYESELYHKNQDYKNPKILKNSYSQILKKEIENFKINYILYQTKEIVEQNIPKKDVNIPKKIELLFDDNRWIFSVYANNIKYIFAIQSKDEL